MRASAAFGGIRVGFAGSDVVLDVGRHPQQEPDVTPRSLTGGTPWPLAWPPALAGPPALAHSDGRAEPDI